MRRWCLIFLLTLGLLTGCSGREDHLQPALDFRASLLQSGGCSFSCDVVADQGERCYQFSLDCGYRNGVGSLTLTAPKTVAGISAQVSDRSKGLEFEGVSLELGQLANGSVAPLSVPWLLGSAWESDFLESAGNDGAYYLATYLKDYEDEELTIQTWFEKQIPVFAEISYDGRRVLAITIRDFLQME